MLAPQWMLGARSRFPNAAFQTIGWANPFVVLLLATSLLTAGCAEPARSPNALLTVGPGPIGRSEPLPPAISDKEPTPAPAPLPEPKPPAPIATAAQKEPAPKPVAVADSTPKPPEPAPVQPNPTGGLPASDQLAGRISGKPPATQPKPAATSAPSPPSPRAIVETVVLPVRPSAGAMKAGTIKVSAGGRESVGALWYVYPEAAASAPAPQAHDANARAHEWLAPAPTWHAAKSPPKSTDPAPQGLWVACIELPEGAAPESVAVEGRPATLPAAPSAPIPRSAHIATSAFARSTLDGFHRNPLLRWRARLASGDLLIADSAAGKAPDAFADATLEGLARSIEREWALVLSRLNTSDPILAQRFVARLAGVVDIGDGVAIPIWPENAQTEGTLDALLAELLRAGSDSSRAAQVALAWLGAQPVGGAIVIDDAAAIDIRAGITFPSVLLANLSDLPATATASRAEVSEPDLLRLEPLTAIFASIGAEAKPDETLSARQRSGLEATRAGTAHRLDAQVRVGDWHATCAVRGTIARIGPPGHTIENLMSDWTEQSFLTAATGASPPELPLSAANRGFVGQLKPATDNGAGPAPGRWMLYFEIERTEGAQVDQSEITLYFGPRAGTGSISLRVLADGSLFEGHAGQSIPAGRATVTKVSDRTHLWIPVPPQAIEGGRVLRLGLVRTDSSGRRAAWPRPMLPWQTEPGRIAVDLSTWSPAKE